MFPPEVFGVGVTVAELSPAPLADAGLPAGVLTRPTRLGEMLPVAWMSPQHKALQLQRIEQVESALAAFKAELVVGLAAAVTLTPACGLAGATPAYARSAMTHVREAAKYLLPD
jgi:hypothetical protein